MTVRSPDSDPGHHSDSVSFIASSRPEVHRYNEPFRPYGRRTGPNIEKSNIERQSDPLTTVLDMGSKILSLIGSKLCTCPLC